MSDNENTVWLTSSLHNRFTCLCKENHKSLKAFQIQLSTSYLHGLLGVLIDNFQFHFWKNEFVYVWHFAICACIRQNFAWNPNAQLSQVCSCSAKWLYLHTVVVYIHCSATRKFKQLLWAHSQSAESFTTMWQNNQFIYSPSNTTQHVLARPHLRR